jgi:hypothetical protein
MDIGVLSVELTLSQEMLYMKHGGRVISPVGSRYRRTCEEARDRDDSVRALVNCVCELTVAP